MAQVVPVLREAYPRLAGFLSAFPGESSGAAFWNDRFHLWWDANPAFESEAERGWMLQNHEGIVGFCGIIPSRFRLGGQDTTVFNATTWRVLPAYRAESLRLLFKATHAARHSLLFCTTPSDVTVAALKALKFELLPRRAGKRSVVILDPSAIIKVLLGPGRVSALLGRACALGLQVRQRNLLAGAGRIRALERVREVTRADAAFDGLWERTRTVYANTNVRSAEAVNWLCFGNKALTKTLLGYYENDGLEAYAVFRLNQGGRLKSLECLDIWGSLTRPEPLEGLVMAAAAHAQAQSADIVVFPHFSEPLGAGLKRLGLIQVAEADRKDYFKGSPHVIRACDARTSYFVGAQGDNGL